MYILSLAIKNLLRNKRKTFVLALLITIVSSLVFVSNAIFEQTNTGLKSLFTNYLTADYIISENSEKINSIFGYEMPLVSEYEPVDQLQAFLPISEKLDNYSDILDYTPIISAAVRLEVGSATYTVPVFGIESKTYFEMFKDISVDTQAIEMLSAGNDGILLNKTLASSIEASIKRPLVVGEDLQLSTYTEGSFRIRKGKYAGVFSYPSESEPFNRVILSDPQLVRELLQYTNALETVEILEVENELLFEDSFDDLFSSFEDDIDVTTNESETDFFNSIDSLFEQTEENTIDYSSIITWSFILLKEKNGVSSSNIKDVLESEILNNTDVKLMDWTVSAGLSAQAPIALQISFNIGMAFIILGAMLVIVNGLVISVLERTNEIGTMRAIGASSGFIKKLYSTEMILLIIFFSIVGITFGILLCALIQLYPIQLHNDFLITLFGSSVLKPLISTRLICIQLLASTLVAMVSWQYPVYIAIRIQPAHTMGKGI